MARRGYRTISLRLTKSGDTVPVRASARIADALNEISSGMDLYRGVRLLQILEAIYIQGKKDGARDAFAAIDRSTQAVKKEIPHRSVGRPRRSN